MHDYFALEWHWYEQFSSYELCLHKLMLVNCIAKLPLHSQKQRFYLCKLGIKVPHLCALASCEIFSSMLESALSYVHFPQLYTRLTINIWHDAMNSTDNVQNSTLKLKYFSNSCNFYFISDQKKIEKYFILWARDAPNPIPTNSKINSRFGIEWN